MGNGVALEAEELFTAPLAAQSWLRRHQLRPLALVQTGKYRPGDESRLPQQAALVPDVSGVDWGLPGFGDTRITKNLPQLLAAGRAPHGRPLPCWPQRPTLAGPNHESYR